MLTRNVDWKGFFFKLVDPPTIADLAASLKSYGCFPFVFLLWLLIEWVDYVKKHWIVLKL